MPLLGTMVFVSDAPGHVDENSVSYLPDLPVLVRTTLYICLFCCVIITYPLIVCLVPEIKYYLLTYFLTILEWSPIHVLTVAQAA